VAAMLALGVVLVGVPAPRPVALQPARPLRADNSTGLPITKAERDKRNYRGLQLSNGMHTVLVSDPDAEMTAASVDVHVGSWSDPDDLAGLAHFCEHMLFMSSKKYTEEDGYAKFLESNGGGANAFTASTHTNYFFAVQPKALQEAMDRLAQFFIAPDISEDAVSREVLAVNSENEKNQQSDGWRKDQLLRSLASKTHPYHKFGTGSNVSLNVPNITGRLAEWYHEHYGAPVMTLAVVGNENLATLEKWAEESFGSIPSRGATVPTFEDKPRPYPESEMPRAYLVQPVLHAEELSVAFSLPGVEGKKTSLPLDFLSHLLGHEADGSLTALLADKGWAQGVWAGADEAEADMTLFTVDVALSDEGVKHWDSVLALVFEAVHVAVKGVTNATYTDLQRQQSLGFEFADVSSPDDYAVTLSSTAQVYWPPKDVLVGPEVISFFDRNLVLSLLEEYMTPEKMLVLLSSTSLTAGDGDAWKLPQGMDKPGELLTEKWYGTQYQELHFSANTLAALKTASKNDASVLAPPRVNPYMPTSFEMIDPKKLGAAELTLNQTKLPHVDMWHKVSLDHDKPSALFYVELRLPQLGTAAAASDGSQQGDAAAALHNLAMQRASVAESPAPGQPSARPAVMAELHLRLVGESLRSLSFEASGAGLNCWESPLQTRGLSVQCEGFSDTLPQYMASTIAAVRGLHPEKVAFDTQLEEMQRDYQDAMQGGSGASGLASAYADRALYRIAFLPAQLEAVSHKISLGELAAFADAAFAEATGVALALGNLNRTAAATIMTSTLKAVRTVDYAKMVLAATSPEPPKQGGVGGVPRQAVAKLDGGWNLIAVTHPNPDETNCAVLLTVQLGQLDRQHAATAILLGDIISQPFFSELRTKQQLGYIVSGRLGEARGVYSLSFVVQSSVKAPAHVTSKMHEFLNSTMTKILTDMKEDELGAYVSAARQRLLQKPKSLSEEGGMLWARVADQSFDFARNHELARLLGNGTVMLEHIRDMHKRTLPLRGDGRAGRLLVWVVPQKGEAAAAEPTTESAPQGYELVNSIDDLRANSSYFPQPQPPAILTDRADRDAMAERLATMRPESAAINSHTSQLIAVSAPNPQPLYTSPAKACSKMPCSAQESRQEGRGPNARRRAAMLLGYRHAK
jgi:insulysin